MALLQSLLHITDFQSPLLQTAVPAIATCFAIQNAVGIPSVLAQTEHVYDLSGGVTFVAASAASLLVRAARSSSGADELGLASFDWHQLAVTGCTMVYATRRQYLYAPMIGPFPPSMVYPRSNIMHVLTKQPQYLHIYTSGS